MSSDRQTITVRLTPAVLQRLDQLCEHLGTNRNSYLVNAIGRSISQDEVAFNSTRNSSETHALMQSMFSQFVDGVNASIQEQQKELDL